METEESPIPKVDRKTLKAEKKKKKKEELLKNLERRELLKEAVANSAKPVPKNILR